MKNKYSSPKLEIYSIKVADIMDVSDPTTEEDFFGPQSLLLETNIEENLYH